jgi:hypothetical protein
MLAWYPRSFRYQPDCDGSEGCRLHPAGLRIKPSLANLDIAKNAVKKNYILFVKEQARHKFFDRYTYMYLC